MRYQRGLNNKSTYAPLNFFLHVEDVEQPVDLMRNHKYLQE